MALLVRMGFGLNPHPGFDYHRGGDNVIAARRFEKRRRRLSIADANDGDVYELAFVMGVSEMVAMCLLKSLAFFLFFWINNAGDSPFSYWYIFSMLIIGVAPSTLIDVYFVSFFISFSKRLLD